MQYAVEAIFVVLVALTSYGKFEFVHFRIPTYSEYCVFSLSSPGFKSILSIISQKHVDTKYIKRVVCICCREFGELSFLSGWLEPIYRSSRWVCFFLFVPLPVLQSSFC